MVSVHCGLIAVIVVLCGVDFVHPEPTWGSLRATWGLNLFSSRVFSKLPKTENKARSEGFVRLAGECSGGKFLGHRYMKGLDTAAVLIYDDNGYIAGIQSGIPKNDVERSVNTSLHIPSPLYDNSSAYQLDKILGEEEVYFLTAYFVNPSIICSGGRTSEEYEEQGTGTGLHLQNGSNPNQDTVAIPLYEKDMVNTSWVKGGCFRTMGLHYWYGAHENMSCSDFFPFTVIYNRGKVTSFAFVNFGHFEFSRRFEHPSSTSLSIFMPTPVPKCLYEEYEKRGGVSSMHIFFSVRPWNIMC